MTRIRIVPAQAYRRERWKNRLGWTHEIARGQAASTRDAAWDWRLSIALIDRDCAFSAFPGVDRVLVLIEGEGMRLRFDDGVQAQLTSEQPQVAFAGERAVDCALQSGPTRDFNAMWRRDRLRGRVTRERLDGERTFAALPPGALRAIHLLAGQARFRQRPDLPPLASGDTALIEEASGGAVLEGDGEMLIARLEPLHIP